MKTFKLMPDKAFTLLELILTITLAGILFTVASIILHQGIFGYFKGKDLESHHLEKQIAVDRIARELRGATTYTAIAPEAIHFKNHQNQEITFFIENNTLYRQQAAQSKQPLLKNLQTLNFRYYDKELLEVAQPQQVKYVNLKLVLEKQNQPSLTYEQVIYTR